MSAPTPAPHLHRSVSFVLFIVASLLSLPGSVLSTTITISSPEDLVDISNNVNSGTTYSGTTVYLGSDLDFSSVPEQFKPIGINKTHSFQGTFDGRGHVISNLNINSASEFVGVFGFSYGATFKNVVLDDSCSVVCSHDYSTNPAANTNNTDIGSVSGYCELCTFESVVNMASVSFIGNVNHNLRIGGIVGRILNESSIINCVNYGSVTQGGIIEKNARFGGIAGLYGDLQDKAIQNCANYGTLTHNGTTAGNLHMAGILGNNYNVTIVIENCVSAGKIVSTTKGGSINYIGSIVGYVRIAANVLHCLWTNDVGCVNPYSYSKTTITVTNSALITLNATTASDLNEYAKKNSTWDKWVTLRLNGGAINSLAQDTLTVTQEHFPDPVKSGNTFLFWCLDDKCAERYYSGTTGITGITDLYAGWNMGTVTFNFGDGASTTRNVVYNEKYKNLPDGGEKEGHTFVGWFTKEGGAGERVTSETTVSVVGDHTLYAQWAINNYTLTFILNNGENDVVKLLNYSDKVDYPGDPSKEGHTFAGWSPKPTTMPAHNLNIIAQWAINNYTLTFTFDNGANDVVKLLNYSDKIDYPDDPSKEGHTFAGWSPKTATMPAHNLNVTAQWIEKPSEYVEIVFNKKDISEDEIREIIVEYTNDNNFAIETIVPGERTGEMNVIVKFSDSTKAMEFIRNVNENVKTSDFIKCVNVVSNYVSSSPVLCPLALFALVLGSILIL